MPRIPESEIERLKTEISVERLVASAGITLKKSGKDQIGQCPFHDDAEPSLVITSSKNLWHCFGCQSGGGPIDWVMKQRGVSFRHAVELLREGLPSSLAAGVSGAAASTTPIKRSTVRTLAAPVALDADDQQLLNDTVAYYHQRLKQSPEALAYLKARGLDHPELIDTFKLGVADRSLGLRLPDKTRKAGEALRTRLQKLGILRESGHEHFNGSLVIPVFDEQGNVVEVYGRKIRDDLRPGTPKHLYLPGPHAGVFNLQGLPGAPHAPHNKEIILCEALIDALTFWCAGFRNVTSAYGVEGFTDEMFNTFKRLQIERVLIAYDRDDAGESAAQKLAARLIGEGIECLRVLFPKGLDANAYARKVQPARASLALALRQAEWIGRGAPPAVTTVTQATPVTTVPPPAPAAAPVLPAVEHTPPFAPSPLAAAVVVDSSPCAPLGTMNTPDTTPTAGATTADERTLTLNACQWRVRGLTKNTSPEQLRVQVQVRRSDHDGYHLDTLDLYQARARAGFIRAAAVELGLPEDAIKRDLGTLLLQLETLQDAAIREQRERQPKTKTPILSAEAEAAALALLKAPDLIARIAADLQHCGVVGEANNLLAGYLAAVSRKLDTPLAILIQSSSAAGKSSLMDAVLSLVPEEERLHYSAMSGQSLFYLGETDLQHKILAIAEEEGVRQAAYALKLLQSEGELTMASTGKDEASGNLVTKQYRVKGPVMLMLTTTAIDIDEELMNRCLVLTINESREQTQVIHARQREKQTLQGLLASHQQQTLTTLHQNAQRLLQPLNVVNPYAEQLTFLNDKTRTRRDHLKYLTLIRAIALLHQHQREVKTVNHHGQTLTYIEATTDDIRLANHIAHEVLGRTLDELPPQTRRLLTLLQGWVEQRAAERTLPVREFRFTRREVREALAWGDTQLKLHLARLTELEYLGVHRRGTTFEYELIYDGTADERSGARHLCGLIDPDQWPPKHGYDSERSGGNGHRSGSGRPPVGGWSGGGRPPQNTENDSETNTYINTARIAPKPPISALEQTPAAAVVAAH